MRGTPLLAAGVLAVFAVSAASPTHAIYDGERAQFRSFGFMVSLQHSKRHGCGGTLIVPEIVLTAAHCLTGVKATKLKAVVGTDNPASKNARRVRVTGYRVPPGFSIRSSNRNDLALLRLAEAQASPVLALADAEPEVEGQVAIAGWGCTDRPPRCRRFPTHLRTAPQRVVSDSRCDRSTFWNPPAHAPTSICARGSNAVANLGDSGGPLLVGDAQVGFTQVGVASLLSDRPRRPLNAYASVPRLRGWIDTATAALLRDNGR